MLFRILFAAKSHRGREWFRVLYDFENRAELIASDGEIGVRGVGESVRLMVFWCLLRIVVLRQGVRMRGSFLYP